MGEKKKERKKERKEEIKQKNKKKNKKKNKNRNNRNNPLLQQNTYTSFLVGCCCCCCCCCFSAGVPNQKIHPHTPNFSRKNYASIADPKRTVHNKRQVNGR